MKIHYTTPKWHGGFNKFVIDAFNSLGHEVCYFDDFGTKFQRFFWRIGIRLPRLQYGTDDYFRKIVSYDWIKSVCNFKPDLVLIEHAPNILPFAIEEIKKRNYKIFYWIDSPPAGSQAKDVLSGMALADKIFAIDRDRKWMTLLYEPSDFYHLPLAGDPNVFFPIKGIKKEYDVVFVGSFPPQTGDGYLRAKIVANIPSKYRVAVFGNGVSYWIKYFPILKERIKSGNIVSASIMNEIYNKSEIVLNIHSIGGHTSSLSARTYEIGLSRAFQLVDWREDLDVLFPGVEFPTFRYFKEINDLIEKWISVPDKRKEIAKKIREIILKQHTWRNRAEQIMKMMRD